MDDVIKKIDKVFSNAATFYGAHGHYCQHKECGGAVYVCQQITHCRKDRNHPCPDHDPACAAVAEPAKESLATLAGSIYELVSDFDKVCTERDELRAQVEELRAALMKIAVSDDKPMALDQIRSIALAAREKAKP